MKSIYASLGLITLFLLLSCTMFATDYTLSRSTITISTPGSHTISGTGSGQIDINGVSGNVFEITLDNITLIAGEWASAITCNNTSSTGTMTVKFIVKGTNLSRGGNHGGIKAGDGAVNVMFTTKSSGSLTLDASYSENFALQADVDCTLTPSIDTDPTVNCTAILEGNSVSNTVALTDAFTKKPLVLNLNKVYTLSNGGQKITATGSCTLTGTGSNEVDIVGITGDVFEITLDNMSLTAGEWASAIYCKNSSPTGTMTVKFIVKGTNLSKGGNHAGIQVGIGAVNVIFTTTSSGSLTLDANYEETYALKADVGCTLTPSIDSNVNCAATLEGNSVTNAVALTDAFTKKPLVLNLSQMTTGVTADTNKSSLKIKNLNDKIQIEGLKKGESFRIYDMLGKSVFNSKAQNDTETLILSKGIYVIQTSNARVKFTH